ALASAARRNLAALASAAQDRIAALVRAAERRRQDDTTQWGMPHLPLPVATAGSVAVRVHLLVSGGRGEGRAGRRTGGADGAGRARARHFTGQAGHLRADGLAEQAVHTDGGDGDERHDDDVFGHALAAHAATLGVDSLDGRDLGAHGVSLVSVKKYLLPRPLHSPRPSRSRWQVLLSPRAPPRRLS